MTRKGEFSYEESAEVVTVTGWACKTCRTWWGKNEHMARRCCAKDCPCECGGRLERDRSWCDVCRSRKDAERWGKVYANAVEWDGKAPLACWHGDRFFWSVDDLWDYLDRDGAALDDLRLVLAVEVKPRWFSLSEFMQDELYEGFEEGGAFKDIDKAVNDFIQGGRPWSWEAGDQAVTVESVRAFLGEPSQ